MCASEGADECASKGAEGVKECASEGAEGVCPRGRFLGRGRNKECTGEGALHAPARTLTSAPARALMHRRSAPAKGAEMCASEGADKCASEGAEGVKECGSEGAEGVCARGRFQQCGRNKECTGEGVLHAPARTLKECASQGAESANGNEGCFIKNAGNLNFGFVTEAPTVPEDMLFGMYAWNIYAPLPWFVAVEPFLVSTTGQRFLQ